MATWIDPVDSQTDPDAPITSDLAKRWDNNVVAAFEGSPGAPTLDQASTMGEWYYTIGEIGTYAMLRHTPDVLIEPGQLVTGNLRYSTAGGVSASVNVPGTWMCMGAKAAGTTVVDQTTLWLRVS